MRKNHAGKPVSEVLERVIDPQSVVNRQERTLWPLRGSRETRPERPETLFALIETVSGILKLGVSWKMSMLERGSSLNTEV